MRITTSRLGGAVVYAVFLLAWFALLDLGFGSFAAARDRSFRTAHAYYHHGLAPSRTASTTWAERRYEMRTDSLGFRDASNALIEPRRAGPRVVLIGDSMMEGLGVRYEDTAAGLLAARGRERGIEVLNAAVVSYSPKLYELRTRWLVEHDGLRFDRLVVFVDISDIQDEVHYEAFVPDEEGGWSAALSSWWQRRSLVSQLRQRFESRRLQVDNRFVEDADLAGWLRTVDAYRNPVGNPDAGRWQWTYDQAAYRAFGQRGLALAESHMAGLAAFCREHAIELVLVVYPSPYQIYAKDLESRQVSFWRDFSAREKVAFVNLFPAFIDPPRLAPPATYERYFIRGDVHWNEDGHALVADQVQDAVLAPVARSRASSP